MKIESIGIKSGDCDICINTSQDELEIEFFYKGKHQGITIPVSVARDLGKLLSLLTTDKNDTKII